SSSLRSRIVFIAYTRSGSFGSAVIWPKYQPRCQMRGSPLALFQCAPPSFERYRPPSSASTIAYTRSGAAFEIAMPMRPTFLCAKPSVSCVQCAPPSVDLYKPEPGPLAGGYTFQG